MFTLISSNAIHTNISQGLYRPRFFENSSFNLSRVDYNTVDYSEDDVEAAIIKSNFSFAFLREDKLRTINVFDAYYQKISFNDFLSKFGISINSKNLFKTGKYLSRIFRPVKYGGFYKNLNIYINRNNKHIGKKTDGISLISLKLAHSLGWTSAVVNSSAQFTLFYKKGLVKGNCVVSDSISSDVVIYGNDNIKDEVKLTSGIEFVALEPLKLSNHLRMDIQSILNLWELFGAEQFLEWTNFGIRKFIDDLFAGKLSSLLDDFNTIDEEDYNDQTWTLKKAVWHKIDYRRFPGLLRLAWSMFRNSMVRFATDINGMPVFRIPVPHGHRGYLRVDLRQHDEYGNFCSITPKGAVTVDKLGNIWIHEDDVIEFMAVKGGADLDDNCAIIPIGDGKAVFYRNPNQYGEYGIHHVIFDSVSISGNNRIVGTIPMKNVTEQSAINLDSIATGNALLDGFLSKNSVSLSSILTYNIPNLLRAYNIISNNAANIGRAANAEMFRSAVCIYSKTTMKTLCKKFNWNLENIIDATVKDGSSAETDMNLVTEFFQYILVEGIKVPASLLQRAPESIREQLIIYKKQPLDVLLEAIEYLVNIADTEVLGSGSVSRGNRIKGRIDFTDIPFIEIGKDVYNNPVKDLAMSILKSYNMQMAVLLENTKDLPVMEREPERKRGIAEIQSDLLKKMTFYNNDERELIIQIWAYEIYKSARFVHDSILWISDSEDFRGTADDMIRMLARCGIGDNISNNNGSLNRFNAVIENKASIRCVRVWRKEMILAEEFNDCKEIMVVQNKAVLGNIEVNLGDECSVPDGKYAIRSLNQSISKKNGGLLKNSLVVYLV